MTVEIVRRIELVVRVIGTIHPLTLNRITVRPAEGLLGSRLTVNQSHAFCLLKSAGIICCSRYTLGDETNRQRGLGVIGQVGLVNIPLIGCSSHKALCCIRSTGNGIAQHLFAISIKKHYYRRQVRMTYRPGQHSRCSGDVGRRGTYRRKQRITRRFDTQVVQEEETRARLEEHDIIALCTRQRSTHHFPVLQTCRIVVHIIVVCQMGLTIGQRVENLQGAEVVRIRECTHYNRLTVIRT